jgi:hypothetical protein
VGDIQMTDKIKITRAMERALEMGSSWHAWNGRNGISKHVSGTGAFRRGKPNKAWHHDEGHVTDKIVTELVMLNLMTISSQTVDLGDGDTITYSVASSTNRWYDLIQVEKYEKKICCPNCGHVIRS